MTEVNEEQRTVTLTGLEAARHAAKGYVKIGKLSTWQSSTFKGFYEVWEDGRLMHKGYFDSAADAKADYIWKVIGIKSAALRNWKPQPRKAKAM